MRRRTGAVLLAASVALVATGPPAAAHNRLVGSDPADGSVVEEAPASVVLVFDQPSIALGSRVVVVAPDGTTVSSGDLRLVDREVAQDLAGDLPAGEYRVEWRVTSADGHPVSGELAFTASAPGRGAVAAQEVVDALAVAVVVLRRRRRGGSMGPARPAAPRSTDRSTT